VVKDLSTREALEETVVTRAIIDGFWSDFSKRLDLDVAIAGAGPAGLTAARYLAQENYRVAVFERNLYVGGGMWGGGMLFPKIVIQERAKQILDGLGVKLEQYPGGYYTADSVETVSRCTTATIEAGAKIWIGISVEDVIIREGNRVTGVVINWGAVEAAHLHVDPLAVKSKLVIDATGHGAEVARVVSQKISEANFPTLTGKVIGESCMWSEAGEKEVVDRTCEIFPGLIVAGMAVATVFGSPRMGAIFGGMFLSGRRAADIASFILKSRFKGEE